jgi:hypothetical protein
MPFDFVCRAIARAVVSAMLDSGEVDVKTCKDRLDKLVITESNVTACWSLLSPVHNLRHKA